jgi:hypothetical protein
VISERYTYQGGFMKQPSKKEIPTSGNKNTPQGNRTPAPVDYQDPTGSKEDIHPPQNSGYDEKQPKSEDKK